MTDLITLSQPIAQADSDSHLIGMWLASFRSTHTRRGYETDVQAFGSVCPKALRTIRVDDLQAFAASLTDLAPATQARRLAAIKSLFAFAVRIGYLQFDVGAVVKLPAVQDRLAERIMGEAATHRMLALETNPRNAAMLRLMYAAGLRISEVCSLCWRDAIARDDAGQISVMGKGGKTRTVLLSHDTWQVLIAIHGDASDNDPIFASREGGHLDPASVHRVVKAAAARAGLSDAVSAHWLRHAHVSHSLDRGAPVHLVRETVGHASLETTTRYAHVRPGDSSAKYLSI